MKCSIIDCENPREGKTELCATHNYENRKRLREEKKVKVVRPPNKVSKKRADELLQYPKLKKQFLLHKMACEFRFEGCKISADQIHHCSLSAKNFLNTDTWMACDLHCHQIVESLPAEERRKKGWLTD